MPVGTTLWQFLMAQMALYEDGALVAGPTAATGYVPNINPDMTIGARSDGGFVFNGGIDEVAIYTNTLTASVISAHYQNGINPTPPQSYSSLVLSKSPAFYYRLDETVSTVTSHSSGHQLWQPGGNR